MGFKPSLGSRSKKRKRHSSCKNTYSGNRKQNAKKPWNSNIHKFEVSPEDHCETPGKAYDDIVPVLSWYARRLGKAKEDLVIYDPYYCNGAVIRNFALRGFPKVYNKNEDFYEICRNGRIPDFDVIVTNPPYSDDHIERCIRFCIESEKPYFLLLPNYVYTNEFYKVLQETKKPFYVIPPCRYQYTSPTGMRSNREEKTSPWVSFWYCDILKLNALLIKFWRKNESGFRGKLIGNLSRLPHNMRAQYDKSRRRLRKKQRVAVLRRMN